LENANFRDFRPKLPKASIHPATAAPIPSVLIGIYLPVVTESWSRTA